MCDAPVVVFSSYTYGDWVQYTGYSVVGGLGPQEVVYNGPRDCWPAIIQLPE